jgi:hypothetical protein
VLSVHLPFYQREIQNRKVHNSPSVILQRGLHTEGEVDERTGQVERPTWQVRDGRHTVSHNELAPLLDKILDKDGKIPVSSEDEATKTERLEGVDTTRGKNLDKFHPMDLCPRVDSLKKCLTVDILAHLLDPIE